MRFLPVLYNDPPVRIPVVPRKENAGNGNFFRAKDNIERLYSFKRPIYFGAERLRKGD